MDPTCGNDTPLDAQAGWRDGPESDPVEDAALRLERTLGAYTEGLRSERRRDVIDALDHLDQIVAEQSREAVRLDGMLAELQRHHPRQRNRARAVRIGYGRLADAVSAVRRSLGRDLAMDDDRPLDADRARRELAALRSTLGVLRSRESDLIYEAFHDVFHRDLERLVGGS